MLGLVGLVGCQDDFDAPDPSSVVPVATIEPNTTILEVKTLFWNDATNYIDTIGVKEDGSHYIIAGRVISSDAGGNIYNSLVIQDATAALAISVRYNNLYRQYPIGQEVVIDLTDMYIGKYSGLQQLGFPDYSDTYGWQATFMSSAFLQEHLQLNGSPFETLEDGTVQRQHIDTLTVSITDINNAGASPEGLRSMQSRLVRLNNTYFQDGGTTTVCSAHKVTTDHTLYDDSGNSIKVRVSGYSNFWNDILPEGHGDVVGILSYFNSAWQLLPMDREGFMNFGNPTLSPGAEGNPWTVDQAIAVEEEGSAIASTGWVSGYIVGSVAPEVTTVTSNSDIVWGSSTIMDNTLVIASDPSTTDISKCLVFALPENSKLRQYGNLVDNPSNYGKVITLSGTLAKYMGTYGITGNKGTTAEFSIEGVEIPSDTPTAGDGTESSPYTVAQVRAGATGTSAWVVGYIVGCVDTSNSSSYDYQFAGTTTFSGPANLLLADSPDETTFANCVPVQLTNGTEVRTALNLVSHPENIGYMVKIQGSLETYFKIPGLKSPTAYAWYGDAPTTSTGGSTGGSTDNTTGNTVVSGNDDANALSNIADFGTFNGGEPKSSYGTYTTTSGWTAAYAAIQSGSATEPGTNPAFSFISSSPSVLAACLTGNTTNPGKLTSPSLSGGISKIRFNYGFAFSDTQCQFTVNIKQNGSVVQSKTETISSVTKTTAYTFEWDVTVSGAFTIEIVNDCLSAATSNKDRVSIWNLSWNN